MTGWLSLPHAVELDSELAGSTTCSRSRNEHCGTPTTVRSIGLITKLLSSSEPSCASVESWYSLLVTLYVMLNLGPKSSSVRKARPTLSSEAPLFELT